MNKLKAMQIFVKIVESGSLTAAADHLDLPQSSVVRSLAALEQTLGVQLLYRTTRKIALTDEGRGYYQRCRQILLEVEDAENALSQTQQAPKGRIRLTAPVMFGRMHLGPLVTDFLNHYPDVEVELLLLDRVVDLIEEGMDIALRIGSLPDSSLMARQVGEVQQITCASPDYIAKHSAPKHPDQLMAHSCIHLSAMSAQPEWGFIDANKPLKASIYSRFKTNQVDSARDACCKGLGIGQFLSYQVAEALQASTLAPLLETFQPPALPVSLVYPQSRLLASRSRIFIDWVAPRLSQRLQQPT